MGRQYRYPGLCAEGRLAVRCPWRTAEAREARGPRWVEAGWVEGRVGEVGGANAACARQDERLTGAVGGELSVSPMESPPRLCGG